MKLYGNHDAGRYLRWFAPLAILLYCDAVTDAMIKGLGQQKASVLYNICTNSMDVLFLYILLPRYGIAGYFISFTVTHVINFALSLRRLLKITGISIQPHIPLLSLAATALAVFLSGFVHTPILRTGAGVAILFCMLILTGVVNKVDFQWIMHFIRTKNRPA